MKSKQLFRHKVVKDYTVNERKKEFYISKSKIKDKRQKQLISLNYLIIKKIYKYLFNIKNCAT